MQKIALHDLLALIDLLSEAEQSLVIKHINGVDGFERIANVVNAIAISKKECPHCHSNNVKRWGKKGMLQRFRCSECGKTYNSLTGSPIAHLRKRDEWLSMAAAINEGLSVRKTAEKCNIVVSTAFRWRHRFLETLSSDVSDKLSGIAEADETYFLESRKGERNLPRAPRRRGGKAKRRGLSREQVPVLVAKDRNGNIVDAVLPNHSAKAVEDVLADKLNNTNILCLDEGHPLRSFADKYGIPTKTIPAKQHVHHEEPIFHIQGVNAYHSRLKMWMQRFKGVATKYLQNYLGWRRMYERAKYAISPLGWVEAAVGV